MNGFKYDMIFVKNDDIAFRVVDAEAVLVSPREGEVRILNATAARIWELIDGINTAGFIAQKIAEEYAVDMAEARNDTGAFLLELANRGLIKEKA
jgi:hypothetical protein